MRISFKIFFSVCCFLTFTIGEAGGAENKSANKIYLIPTLHQLHQTSRHYSFEKLKNILNLIEPSIILVELTEKDLASKKQQETKIEYNRIVIPFAEQHKVMMIAMEPNEPLYSELVESYMSNAKQIAKVKKEQVRAFNLFAELYVAPLLNDDFRTVSDLASEKFDALTKLKHDFQNQIYGEKEQAGWDKWNQIFADKIIKTDKESQGKVIAVLVGLEHHYWLKAYLQNKQSLSLEKLNF